MLLERVLARRRRLAAFRKALDLLYWSMGLISYRRIVFAIKMASKLGVFCIIVLLSVALAAAEAIRSEQLPDSSVQWLLE